MAGGHKHGAPCPWPLLKRLIARRWFCRPSDVDAAPMNEIAEELEIMNIEAAHQPKE